MDVFGCVTGPIDECVNVLKVSLCTWKLMLLFRMLTYQAATASHEFDLLSKSFTQDLFNRKRIFSFNDFSFDACPL